MRKMDFEDAGLTEVGYNKSEMREKKKGRRPRGSGGRGSRVEISRR